MDLIESENKTMKKWLIILMGLTLVAAVTTGAAFTLTGSGSDTPVEGSEGQIDKLDGDLPPIRSDEDMDPNECNWIHNITACEGAELGSEDGVEPDQGIAVGEPYPMPIPGTPGDTIPVSDVVCGPDQAVSITSEGQVSCWDLEPNKVDKDAEVSPGMPPVVEPAR